MLETTSGRPSLAGSSRGCELDRLHQIGDGDAHRDNGGSPGGDGSLTKIRSTVRPQGHDRNPAFRQVAKVIGTAHKPGEVIDRSVEAAQVTALAGHIDDHEALGIGGQCLLQARPDQLLATDDRHLQALAPHTGTPTRRRA